VTISNTRLQLLLALNCIHPGTRIRESWFLLREIRFRFEGCESDSPSSKLADCHFGSGNSFGVTSLRLNISVALLIGVLFGGVSRKVPLWKTSREITSRLYVCLSRHGRRHQAVPRELWTWFRPTFPDAYLMIPETRLMFLETRLMFPETRPKFPETRPMFPETRPMFPTTRRTRGYGVARALWRYSARQGTPLFPVPPITRAIGVTPLGSSRPISASSGSRHAADLRTDRATLSTRTCTCFWRPTRGRGGADLHPSLAVPENSPPLWYRQ
jgi:hypothetical protein